MMQRKPSLLGLALAGLGMMGLPTGGAPTTRIPRGLPCIPGLRRSKRGGGKKGGGKKCKVRPVAMGSQFLVGARRSRRQAKLFRKTALLSYED